MKKSVIRAGIWGVFPWIVATVAVVAFGASFSEMHKARDRYWKLALSRPHDHQDVRQFMIRAALVGLDRPIVFMGDSITEMARLPEEITGHPVVNAGIGGASISAFETFAPRLLADADRPSLIVVALGANDMQSATVQRDYAALLAHLKTMAPRLLAVAVAGGSDLINAQIKAAAEGEGVPFVAEPMPDDGFLPDHIHLNAAGYRAWLPVITAAVLEPNS